MTPYGFEAARADGSVVKGQIRALSAAAAADILTRRGLVPITVTETPPAVWRGRRVPVREQATMLRALASLVSAGVPLAAALHTTRQVMRGALQETLTRSEERVREGLPLAAALESEALFTPVTIGLLRAGEAGSGLANALDLAAVELEQRADVISRVRGALAYPAVLLAVGIVSVGAIVLVVVPRFAALLGDVRATLPLSTRALLAVSEILRRQGVQVLAAIAAVTAAVAFWVASRRSQWHVLLLAAPVIGPFRHTLASVRGARALAALLDRGAPALTALSVARTAVADAAVSQRLSAAGERVAQGASLSQALNAEATFTALTLQLASIGDGAGRLPELLRRAADIEERLAEQRLRTFVALLEPTLVVLFAVVVAVVAAALLQAVYSVRPGSL